MAKEVVFVSAVQLATAKHMRRKLDDNGILTGEIAATYKQNVVKGLVTAGVMRPFRTHYKFNDVKIMLRVHTPRTPKAEADPAVEMAQAA